MNTTQRTNEIIIECQLDSITVSAAALPGQRATVTLTHPYLPPPVGGRRQRAADQDAAKTLLRATGYLSSLGSDDVVIARPVKAGQQPKWIVIRTRGLFQVLSYCVERCVSRCTHPKIRDQFDLTALIESSISAAEEAERRATQEVIARRALARAKGVEPRRPEFEAIIQMAKTLTVEERRTLRSLLDEE